MVDMVYETPNLQVSLPQHGFIPSIYLGSMLPRLLLLEVDAAPFLQNEAIPQVHIVKRSSEAVHTYDHVGSQRRTHKLAGNRDIREC